MAATLEMGLALMPIGDRIRELRRACKLSRAKLSIKSGVQEKVIQRLEEGEVDDPMWSTVLALARGLGVTPNDLQDPEPDAAAPQSEGPAGAGTPPEPAQESQPKKRRGGKKKE